MFFDFILIHAPAIVAAVVLLPVLAFSIALFLEGARKSPWKRARPGIPARPVAARRQSPRRDPRTVMGSSGLRHGIAARRDHD